MTTAPGEGGAVAAAMPPTRMMEPDMLPKLFRLIGADDAGHGGQEKQTPTKAAIAAMDARMTNLLMHGAGGP